MDIIDYFSKYILSYPLQRKDSENVLPSIKEFVYSVGRPNIIQTDNGLEFLNNKLVDFCKEKNIQFIQSRPRNPKCNGIIEVSHKEIRKYILTKYATEDNEEISNFNLKDIILEACYIHNNNIHSTKKRRPVDLIKNTDNEIYEEVLDNIKNALKRKNIEYTVLKKMIMY